MKQSARQSRMTSWRNLFLHRTPRSRLRANVFTLNAGINAYGKGSQWNSGVWLLEQMYSSGLVPTVISHNAVISACDRTSQWPVALSSLGVMPDGMADLVSCNSALSACSRKNWVAALTLASSMPLLSLAPDEFTCGSLLLVSEQRESWSFALQICARIRLLQLEPNLFTYSSAMTACQESWQHALLLLSALEQSSALPNAVCYTAAMKACERGSQWETALAIYQRAKASNARDELLYDVALRACQQGMQWQAAVDQLFEMASVQLQPDALSFTSVINACTKASEWKSVMKIIATMRDVGVDDFRIARYDHATQAGSTLDCFKHSVLATVVQCLNADPTPYTYVDTHAASAMYSLGSDRQHLVLHLLSCGQGHSWYLASYINVVRNFATSALYPGSPLVALQWLRPQDDAVLFELDPDTCALLRSNMDCFSSAHVKVLQENSYWWLSQHLPKQPHGQRQLILMDPPYEPYETYMAWNLFLVQQLHDSWPSSCILLWYPYLDEMQIQNLYQRVEFLGLENVLVAEFGNAGTSSLETSGWTQIVIQAASRDIQLVRTCRRPAADSRVSGARFLFLGSGHDAKLPMPLALRLPSFFSALPAEDGCGTFGLAVATLRHQCIRPES